MRAFFCKKGNHMTDHEELYRKALAFTGSTETAEEIALSAADQPDPVRHDGIPARLRGKRVLF